MGSRIKSWREDNHNEITFIVTQDCDLRCKYCYIVGKNNNHKMTFDVAKKAIDYFIDNREDIGLDDYIILSFIGGEPLLEIELIDQIVDYFKIQTYLKNSPWFGRYYILMSSNGTTYNTEKVQRFLKKNKNLCYIGITIDGTKIKHNLNRVFPDGRGSYDIVLENVKLWLNQFFHPTTKVTISHDDLPYLSESIIHLYNLGLYNVPANVVFENVWEAGDDDLFQTQLIELADYIIKNNMWKTHNTTLFSDYIGFKRGKEDLLTTFCGTGKMYAVDSEGIIYPCLRFMEYSLEGKKNFNIGNISTAIDKDKLRTFKILNIKNQSSEECNNCSIGTGCTTCNGYSYQTSSKNTNFDRDISICKMHKARVRAKNYYWARLYNEFDIEITPKRSLDKKMIFLLSDNSVEFCTYHNFHENYNMSPENLLKGLNIAFNNFYQPIFIHPKSENDPYDKLVSNSLIKNELKRHIIQHIYPYQTEKDSNKDSIYIFNKYNINIDISTRFNNCILILNNEDITNLSIWVSKILPYANRINIKKFLTYDVLDEYNKQLDLLHNLLLDYISQGQFKEIDIITDRFFISEMDNCFAGEKNITLAPNGSFYICPAFYYNNTDEISDSNFQNFKPEIEMTKLNKSPLCTECDAYQCNRCVFDNKKKTNEYNISSHLQCLASHYERTCSKKLQEEIIIKDLDKWNLSKCILEDINYTDPIELFKINERSMSICES